MLYARVAWLGLYTIKILKAMLVNHSGQFANLWKRRISIAARRGMMYQAHYALRKHLRYSLHNRNDVMEEDDDDTHMQEL